MLSTHTAVVVSTAIYVSDTWKSTRMLQNKLDVFHQQNLRKIIKVTWKNKVSNAEVHVLARTGQRRLQDIVGERRFRFAGHVMRMAPERPARGAIEWTPADGRRKRGRPKKTWRSTFREDGRQEESAGVRKRQWQPTVCAGDTCCPLFYKGLKDLSK